ncbi:MAG TPA: VCBS domain-containing protein [Ramlibacter sp.]|nr:VCBS domain-containing protein [Ramlibacter sp.]
MTLPSTYALLAADSYTDIRPNSDNQAPVPAGWVELAQYQVSGSGTYAGLTTAGFSARVFQGPGGEIVISYAGTQFGGTGIGQAGDWFAGNLPLALGFSGTQALLAAALYQQVRSDLGNNITFTGHSLGGGLAAMMSAYFDRPAYVFAPAPFSKAVDSTQYLLGMAGALMPTRVLLTALAVADPHKMLPPEIFSYTPLLDYNGRAANVHSWAVKGEVLEKVLFPLGFIEPANSRTSLFAGSTELDMTSKHSIDLHAAGLLSPAFQSAAAQMRDALPIMFDRSFYGADPLKDKADFLIKLVRNEVGTPGSPANGMLAHFAIDLGVVQGVSGSSVTMQDALIAQAVEWYYYQPATYTGKQFLQLNSGMLQYTIAAADGLDTTQNLAARYVKGWLAPIVNAHNEFYTDAIAAFGQWNIAAPGGATATALDTTKSQLFIGGAGGDGFTGGDKDDLMFAGAGADTLNGSRGNDVLNGGAGDDQLNGGDGFDRYRIDGNDAILDSDGRGVIESSDGRRVAGSVQKTGSGSYVFLDDPAITASMSGADLTLTLADGSKVTIKNFQEGDLGLHLSTTGTPQPVDRTIIGDLEPVDFDPGTPGIQTRKDELDNVIVNPGQPQPGRSDFLFDSTGNDTILAKAGFDYIDAWRGGNDKLDGGDGDDIVLGRDGDDTVIGGAGNDLLRGDAGKDSLFANAEATLQDALAAQDAPGTGQKGDFFDGGSGNDLVVGGLGNDAVNGGDGDDVLVGGAGNDDLDGDLETSVVTMDWFITRQVINNADGSTTYFSTYNNVGFTIPTSGGDDAIYGGGGEDWVRAGYGDDYVDGGSGNDVLFGQRGNDQVFGGTGNDLVMGDAGDVPVAEHGDDYLDGEEGDDTLGGGGGADAMFGGVGNDTLVGDYDVANAGTDYLDGEDGNDLLFGAYMADQLFGGTGNDTLVGGVGSASATDGDDYLDGEAGNDLLAGGTGRDTLVGGAGSDRLGGDIGGETGGDGDAIFGDAGNDTIDGQGGDDAISAGADNDLVAAGSGNDSVTGGDGQDQLQGGDGDDALGGDAGSDTLFGESGNDSLYGGGDTDFLIGGQGDDLMDGGDGDDVYYWNAGDGNDSISDSAGTDWLVLPFYWYQLALGVGSLEVRMPGGGSVHLQDFDPDNPFAAGGIEYFQFADNSVMSKAQLINALGFTPTGTPGNDSLSGTALNETIHALAGDDLVHGRGGNDTIFAEDGADQVWGGAGNDVLAGGAGSDLLVGEAGNDTVNGDAGNDTLGGGAGVDLLQGGEGDDAYVFQEGDGQDTALDALGNNIVAMGLATSLAGVMFSRQGNDLVVAIRNTTDRLTVKDWFTADSHFGAVMLGDGTVLDHAGVEAAMPNNQAPVANPDTASVAEDTVLAASGNALANDSDPEGHALRITNPGAFGGQYGSLSLSSTGGYTYTLANGSTAVQGLGAGQAVTEVFPYTVTDDDPNGAASAQGAITVTVTGANDVPLAVADTASTREDWDWISGNVLGNDSDIDNGSVLTVANPGTRGGTYGSLTLAADGTWVYTLDNALAAVQALGEGQTVTEQFNIFVTDGLAQVASSLDIQVEGANDSPELAISLADQTAGPNTSWTWQVPSGTFIDPDAGTELEYTARLADGSALPSWLTFDPTTHTFSGRVPKTATGSLDIQVRVTDGHDNSEVPSEASDVFSLVFTGGSGGGGGGGGNGGGNGGGSQGNEGVGNGEDAPPPGHDTNQNDGPGTAPGSPGSQGGKAPDFNAIMATYALVVGPAPVVMDPSPGSNAAGSDTHQAPGQSKQALVDAAWDAPDANGVTLVGVGTHDDMYV